MSDPLPKEITDMLKVRVNHDLEQRDTGTWIASVSVYKALRAQQERIAELEAAIESWKKDEAIWKQTETDLLAANKKLDDFLKWYRAIKVMDREPGDEKAGE